MTAKVTIDDVAARAGVGRTTASRVLNGGPNVRAEVRARVLAAVRELDYRVNMQARFLAGGQSRLVAIILPSRMDAEPNSYYASALEIGALHASASTGFQLLTRNIDPDSPSMHQDILDLIAARNCDGIILTPPFSDDFDLVVRIGQSAQALVCVSPGRTTRVHAPSLGIDDDAAGHRIGTYLLALGHRRVAFVRGIEGHRSADERYEGFRRAMSEAGVGDPDVAVARGDFTFRSGIEIAPTLMASHRPPTAMVCANDDMAAGALFAAHKLGTDVPASLSIVGFDDTPVSAILWPPLTTIHQPIKEMGHRAMELAIAQFAMRSEEPPRASFELLPHTLVERQSTGPAAARA